MGNLNLKRKSNIPLVKKDNLVKTCIFVCSLYFDLRIVIINNNINLQLMRVGERERVYKQNLVFFQSLLSSSYKKSCLMFFNFICVGSNTKYIMSTYKIRKCQSRERERERWGERERERERRER